jgi:lipoate-protein ligase A
MTHQNFKLRLIIDTARGGAENMAQDEAILEGVNRGESPGTLRFYRWVEPTISLGYFQPYDEVFAQDEAVRRLPVVRRQTGGGAILHDDELTYSLVLPAGDGAAAKIETMYQIVHDAFIAAMGDYGISAEYRGGRRDGHSQRGPFFCFARHHRLDVVVGGDKILGSAQRRIRGAVLQHGSLILDRHFDQQPCGTIAASATQPFDERAFMARAGELIGNQLELSPVHGALAGGEIESLPRLCSKYASADWTKQR